MAKEYALILVEVTDAIKDGDELMELAPGVRLVNHMAISAHRDREAIAYGHRRVPDLIDG